MKRTQKFHNSRKSASLKELDRASLDDDENDLTQRCKFNLSYLDHTQKAGQTFSDLTQSQLEKILLSLQEYCRFSLDYWETQGSRFVVYPKFPTKTEFKHPPHVPHQACWGRFRLGSKFRLVGFRIPPTLHGKPHEKTNELYDKNTFYIVFIDQNHLFWKTEKK